ncbi:helix-turn-helix domain-containing protein [Ferruginibacter albus]|uniref:helix-turn-helix domain-containing protein n=1 Tax=Ferruginibacter albus TaxID=2875540 RepID=UPI001CC7C1EC|nr:helix-turn-helix domain-containing protein [Ferruginibacter albus]UAY52312.1 AraC family transcriptional regulator [Ferruginibacter albus]
MHNPIDILNIANKRPMLLDEMELLQDVDRLVPGSINYQIRRYRKVPQFSFEDSGMLVYHFEKNNPEANYLELRFCIAGNMYCNESKAQCNGCITESKRSCNEKIESVDVLSFSFKPSYLTQFAKDNKNINITEEVLSFTHKSSFSKILPLCNKTRMTIESLLNHAYTDTRANIFINAQTQILLLYSMDCMLGIGTEKEEVFTCKFLANADDREKITKAREVLLQHIGEPLTIKELSRKVAINECYLKKGFKEMFGTTIFDFYQSQRMEHAKYLLYDKGLSVTEVSLMLGYSSISHFSTAFKKHTGIKPCELLLH